MKGRYHFSNKNIRLHQINSQITCHRRFVGTYRLYQYKSFYFFIFFSFLVGTKRKYKGGDLKTRITSTWSLHRYWHSHSCSIKAMIRALQHLPHALLGLLSFLVLVQAQDQSGMHIYPYKEFTYLLKLQLSFYNILLVSIFQDSSA